MSPHVIIFADRAPDGRHRFGSKINSIRYTYSAGAFKIASVLRQSGFSVLVVYSCLNLSFSAITKIINDNSKNLLWVGISTSLLQAHATDYTPYREKWRSEENYFVDPSLLFQTVFNSKRVTFQMPWADIEIEMISKLLAQFKIPLLLGGSHVTQVINGGMKKLHFNTHIIRGNAESYIKEFTLMLAKNREYTPSYVNNNSSYDEKEFKHSTIVWEKSDFIDSDDWLPIEIARGCAFNCSYCNYEHKGRFDLYKNSTILRNELIRNYEVFGIKKYLLVDDLYNDSKEKVRILYDEVWSKLPFKVEWTSYMRLDMFWADPESIDIIKASGAKYGTFGIETLHNTAGKRVGKGLGKNRILETLINLKERWGDDVLTSGQFIAGLPDEPIEHIQETIDWSLKTDLLHSVSWNPLYLFPALTTWRHDETASRLSANSSHYGIKWTGKVWTNNMGLTFSKCDTILGEYYKKNQHFRIHFGNYADLRVAGLSHQEIVPFSKIAIEQLPLEKLGNIIQSKVHRRLKHILGN